MYFTSSPQLGGRIKQRYDDFLVEEVYTNDDGKKIKCEIIDADSKQSELFKISTQPSDKDYLHFHMQKTNTDLQNVIKSFALILRCSKSRIGYAGLKDKRGITSQRISIFNPDLELLSRFDKSMIKIHSFSWSDKQIDIGDLDSNYFEINVRQITNDIDKIKDIANQFSSLIKGGLPNRFGEQRFGGIRSVTHEVGKMFIEQNYKDAVLHYLSKTADLEHDDVKKARMLVKEGNYKGALKAFPRKDYRYELAILQVLNKNPDDYINAFKQLPESIIYLFTHAYQSHLFNLYLDLRQKEFGLDMLKPQDGDIIENGNIMGPLFGYQFELAKGIIGEIEQKVLDMEKINMNMFKLKEFEQMSTKGARRNIKLDIHKFKVVDIGKDTYNEDRNYCKLSFELDKGNYATTVMDELIK